MPTSGGSQRRNNRGENTIPMSVTSGDNQNDEIEEINPDFPPKVPSSRTKRKSSRTGLARGFLSGSKGIFAEDAEATTSGDKNDAERSGDLNSIQQPRESPGVWNRLKSGIWSSSVALTRPLDGVGHNGGAGGSAGVGGKTTTTDDATEKRSREGERGTSRPDSSDANRESKRSEGVKKQDGDEGGNGKGLDAVDAGRKGKSYMWAVKAVVLFLAYNLVDSVDVPVLKYGVAVAAWYLGWLTPTEFIVVFVATGGMSNYMSLGILVLMTNRGTPAWRWKSYRSSPLTTCGGVFVGVSSIALQLFVKEAVAKVGLQAPNECAAFPDAGLFSLFYNVTVPLMEEFVYRDFLLTELSRDLGAWFGILTSAVWYGMILSGEYGVAELAATTAQGVVLGLVTVACHRNIVVPAMAHIVSKMAFSMFPELSQLVGG